jgi:hypothetical protein
VFDIYRSSPLFRLIVQIPLSRFLTFSGINISKVTVNLPFYENISFDLSGIFVFDRGSYNFYLIVI